MNNHDCHSTSPHACSSLSPTTTTTSLCYKRRHPGTTTTFCSASLESLSTPSLAETDDGYSSSTRDDETSYLPARLVRQTPLSEMTLPKPRSSKPKHNNCKQELPEWWNRLRRLAVARGKQQQHHPMEEQQQQLDGNRVLEESSVQVGLAEQNAYSMKQALEEEWHLSSSKNNWEYQADATMEIESFQEDAEDTTDPDSDDPDDDQNAVFDALEMMTVTSSVCSLVEAHDNNVETTAREALEESNLQATTAEKTAQEMQQAVEWWSKKQQQNDNSSNSTRLSNEQAGAAKNANIMPSTTSPPHHTNNCSQSAPWSAPPSQYEAPMDETNIESNEDDLFWHEATTTIPFQEDTHVMEAHLVAQEQTCAVQVLCYETDLMAQAVAELVQEKSGTVSPPPTISTAMPSPANARLGKTNLKVTRRRNRNSSDLICLKKPTRRILFVTPQQLMLLVVLAAATFFAAIRWGGKNQDDGSAGHEPFAAETTMCLYHDLNADSWLPNDRDKQPQCPWQRVDTPNRYDAKTIQ